MYKFVILILGQVAVQCQTGITLIGDFFLTSISIKNPRECITSGCNKTFITTMKKHIESLYPKIVLTITFTNGQTTNVTLTFCSYEKPITGKV